MKKYLLDTNIFLRFLTKDDPIKAEKILAFFQKAERGDIKLSASDLIVAEVVWVLTSKKLFNFSRKQIYDSFLPLLLKDYLEISSKAMLLKIFDLFIEKSIDFIDCYNAVLVGESNERFILSYDGDFDKVPFVVRVEP